jgi:hypothetical protein
MGELALDWMSSLQGSGGGNYSRTTGPVAFTDQPGHPILRVRGSSWCSEGRSGVSVIRVQTSIICMSADSYVLICAWLVKQDVSS